MVSHPHEVVRLIEAAADATRSAPSPKDLPEPRAARTA
jgi:hypothetical protein